MNILTHLTYPTILLAVFGNQICLPIPSIVFLIAGGAYSAHAKMSAFTVIGLGVIGALVADCIWFAVGRQFGPKAMKFLCSLSSDPRRCSKNAHEKFHRYSVKILCIAKFMPGVDALIPPLAGAEGVSFARFLALDFVGSLLWSGSYVALGYVFCNQLRDAILWAKQFGHAFGIAIGIPIGVYAAWHVFSMVRMVGELRNRRISPHALAQKLKTKGKVAVLDLSQFEHEPDGETVNAIPGAFSVDPSVLQKLEHVAVPDDINVILYSASGSHTVSARAAMALKRIGVDKVWVLDGGLEAWRDSGLPVAESLEEPQAVADRLGVKLPPPEFDT